ncbi:MAG: hypothetical protein J6R20_05530 [Clostridia bacterium]|nr:hypothetical protein [Clostridia bacterium]
MKNIFSSINPLSKHTLIFGGIAVMLTVAASVLIYFGSGILWDYYRGMYFANKLLECSRPLSVAVSTVSLCIEYRAKKLN